MKFKKVIAKKLAEMSLKMAIKSCGEASRFGSYEPKQPEKLKALKK